MKRNIRIFFGSLINFSLVLSMSIHGVIGRAYAHAVRRACAVPSCCRRSLRAALPLLAAAALALALFNSTGYLNPRIEGIEERMTDMHAHLQFLSSLYWARLEDLLALETKISNGSTDDETARNVSISQSSDLAIVINSNRGMKALEGLEPQPLPLLRSAFTGQLLPHLALRPAALLPAYHLRSARARAAVDTVIGIPTVRRDHETYITITLSHIIKGMTRAQRNDTLIVVFVGETDLLYVLNTAILIEKSFPKYVQSGLIEVLAPRAAYYPALAARRPTLGDSPRRFRWRTKQNLDALYLMAYSHSRGAYYLMLEDDVIARKFFMTEIKHFRTEVTLQLPQWFYIEFCPHGGIGKLFRAAGLLRFLLYVQLFYDNAPIDWLLESYLADKVCTDDKFSNDCAMRKLTIRPRFKDSLFMHVGMISSLRGKLHKVGLKTSEYPKFFPHANPPVDYVYTTMEEHPGHSLAAAYRGETYFWAKRARARDVLEFWFQRPTRIDRYLIRSGNVEHKTDRLYHGVVEALAADDAAGTAAAAAGSEGQRWQRVGTIDEFGLADGAAPARAAPLLALRLRLTRDNPYALLISEIDLRVADEPAAAAAESGEPSRGAGTAAGR